MDIRMAGISGIETLRQMKKVVPDIPVILMTAFGDVETAVRAVKLGAYDYIIKPFDNEKIIITLKNALAELRLKRTVKTLRYRVREGTPLSELMGSSKEIKMVYDQIDSVSSTDFTVVLYGETGSGKELVARAIHKQSDRGKGDFVGVDFGAIPETLIESELFGYEKGAFTGANQSKKGYFELASKGSLFMDEIGNLPLHMQGKLLRALEERHIRRLGGGESIDIDVRVIVASNEKLENLVNAGKFREDLYHRLNEFTIEIPALRNRKRDIMFLAGRFLDEINLELNKDVNGFLTSAAECLLNYGWPGNVRELRNVIRKTVLLNKNNTVIEAADLTISKSKSKTGLNDYPGKQPFKAETDNYVDVSMKDIVKKGVSEIEKKVITDALRRTEGNKSKAARMLKIDYKTIHYKIKEYGIRFTP